MPFGKKLLSLRYDYKNRIAVGKALRTLLALLFLSPFASGHSQTILITFRPVDGHARGSDRKASLEDALSGHSLGDIEAVTVTAGAFTADDWLWLRNKSSYLIALKSFSFSATTVSQIEEMPDEIGRGYIPIFSNALEYIYVPKIQRINAHAFRENKNLATAVFPDVVSIGASAFIYREKLSNLRVDKLTSVGVSALEKCVSLTEVTAPMLKEIGRSAWAECAALTKAEYPNAKRIGDAAFYSCKSLATISFPNVTAVGQSAFLGCALLEAVNLPKATEIGSGAFSGCEKLRTASFASLRTMGSGTFSGCANLTKCHAPLVEVIEYSAFLVCVKLKEALFPEATKMDGYVFQGCQSLDTVSIPQIAKLESLTFSGCASLRVADFPRVTRVENSAFEGCTNLRLARFPRLDSIANRDVFNGCASLDTLALGATPPVLYGKYVENTPFEGCPETRHPIFLDEEGEQLRREPFLEAREAYKAVDDGDTGDELWYGWQLQEPTEELLSPVESALLSGARLRTHPIGETLLLEGVERATHLRIYSAPGQPIYSQILHSLPTLMVNATGWKTGIYLARLVDSEGRVKTLKLLKAE